MDHYAGIDVSLEYASVCVVEASGKIAREGKVLSEPAALIAWFGSLPCRYAAEFRMGDSFSGSPPMLDSRSQIAIER